MWLIDEVDSMKNKATNSIAQNINKYGLLNNMTQEQLANALYLDTQYYAQLERGERNFTIQKIILACTIFHVGIENIIVIEDTSVNDNSELLEKIIHDIEPLTTGQLSVLDKFISDVLPYMI